MLEGTNFTFHHLTTTINCLMGLYNVCESKTYLGTEINELCTHSPNTVWA